MKIVSFFMIALQIYMNAISPSIAIAASEEWVAKISKAVSRCNSTLACEFRMLDGSKILGYADGLNPDTFTVTNPSTNEKTVLEYGKVIVVKEIKVINASNVQKKIPVLIEKKKKIELQLLDGTRLKGLITHFDESTLTLQEIKTATNIIIPYTNISKFETEPQGQRIIKKVMIFTGIGLAALFIAAIALLHDMT